MAALIGGLGGPAGFGEGVLERTDDGSSALIDLTTVFPDGLYFYGTAYKGLFVNANGSVSFERPVSDLGPDALSGERIASIFLGNTPNRGLRVIHNPTIAPFWADVDTTGPAGTVSPGGGSAGTNRVYWDLDPDRRAFTATWDDVGYDSAHVDKVNAFQLRLVAKGADGPPGLATTGPVPYSIEYIYENIDWTSGDSSGGSGGLGGAPARVGFPSGDGKRFHEAPESGDEAALLNLDASGTVPGVRSFLVQPTAGRQALAASSSDEVFFGSANQVDTLSVPAGFRQVSVMTGPAGRTRLSGPATGTDVLDSIDVLHFADGRLVFHANDPAAQVFRLYLAALGRAPDQEGLNGWIEVLRAGGSQRAVAEGLLASPEYEARFGALDDAAFVRSVHVNTFGVPPYSGGLDFFAGNLRSGAAARADVVVAISAHSSLPSLAAGIWDRDEGAVAVARLYDALLGRLPDAAGLAFFAGDVQRGAGLSAVASGLMNSSEFAAVHGVSSDAAFVSFLYRNALDREGEADGMASWTRALDTATSRAEVAVGFSESSEHRALTAPLFQPETAPFGILFTG